MCDDRLKYYGGWRLYFLHQATCPFRKNLLFFVMVAVLSMLNSAESAFALTGPIANFDWELEKRTLITTDSGGDPVLQHPILNSFEHLGADGLITSGSALINGAQEINTRYSNSPIHTPISPETFSVTFTSKSGPGDSAITGWSWIIQELNNGPLVFTAPVDTFFIPLARGAYDVTLTVTDQNGMTASIKKTVTVRDLLVVSMGDSFSSGEGNPNKPQGWFGFITTGGPKWQDTIGLPNRTSRCHRSVHAWPVQFAVALEDLDPHTSVTLIHVACSGAQIEGPAGASDGGNSGPNRQQGGLWTEYWGAEVPDTQFKTTLEPQVRQVLKKLCAAEVSGRSDEVGECSQPETMRKIDAMVMSIGINDIRFSAIIEDCVTSLPGSVCDDAQTIFANYHEILPDRYMNLKNILHSVFPLKTLQPSNVYLTKYPDPTHDSHNFFCNEVPDSIVLEYPEFIFPSLPGFSDVLDNLNRFENEFLFDVALTGLNTSVKGITDSEPRWNLIDRLPGGGDLVAEFKPHGYCAGLNRWFRTAQESAFLQGPTDRLFDFFDQIDTTGVIHPNQAGHETVKAATFSTYLANRDTSWPEVLCNPDTLWHATDVTLQCTARDSQVNASGLLNSADGTSGFPLRTNVPAGTETANAVASGYTVCDYDLNCIASSFGGNMIDKKPPSIDLSTPAAYPPDFYIIGQSVPTNYGCTDGGSGVANCVGTLPNGAFLDTLSVGLKNFNVDATDIVGNASVQQVQYAVSYNICPLYDQDRAYRSGSTIPVRLDLCNANGLKISDPSAVVKAQSLTLVSTNVSSEVQDAGNANPDSDFRFLNGSYIYNLSTRGVNPGAYALAFTVTNDPIVHTAQIIVR